MNSAISSNRTIPEDPQSWRAPAALLLDSCCNQVLETMFFTGVEEYLGAISPLGNYSQPESCIATFLPFSGLPDGDIEVRADPQLAEILAANFLGLNQDQISTAEQEQVLREFANMTCGSVLSSLGQVAYFHLGAPVTLRPTRILEENAAESPHGLQRLYMIENRLLAIRLNIRFLNP